MNRSRRGQSAPASFFSFQDVMIAMIGVILVITLLLLMNVGRKSAETVAAAGLDPARSIDSEEARLESHLERLRQAPDTEELREAIARLDVELAEIDTELRASRAEIEARRAETRTRLRETLLAGDAAIARQLLDDQEQLEEDIETVRRRRRLVYLVAEDDSRPVVAELMAGRCVLSTDQARDAPLAINESDPDVLASHVLDWFSLQEGSRHLLIVLKPSGLATWEALRNAMDDPRFADLPVGLDLIAEHLGTTDLFPGKPEPRQ